MYWMSKEITRREFLKGSLYAAAGMAAMYTLGGGIFDFGGAEAAAGTADLTSLAIARDMTKCIGCGKCVEMCTDMQGLDILEMAQNNGKSVSSLKYGCTDLSQTKCIGCGQCARACPSGAITVRDGLTAVDEALADSSRCIVWQFAPSVQHVLGEEFRILSGEDVSGKIAAAAKLLGGYAYRTDFGADITIMEESEEFIKCFNSGEKKPFMTSCCPGWINYVEKTHPELIPNLSSCKSPMEMLGALIKDYLPKKYNVNAEDIFHIAVMPCTAKKHEANRNNMLVDNIRAVDAVITIAEFKNLLLSKGINLAALENEEFDSLFDGTSGSGRIFGASGGVCESALRTVYFKLTGNEAPNIEFSELRGSSGIKTTEVVIGERTIKACVVNGIKNIQTIAQDIANGVCPYDLIEVMACPGGCAGGGGTPYLFTDAGIRQRGMYAYDRKSSIRASHKNETLQKIYDDYLSSPCSELAEELLHTEYFDLT